MKKAIIAAAMALALLTGCAHEQLGYFYVASTSCGYRVASDNANYTARYVTKCLAVEDAKAIADKLNRDVPDGKLAWPNKKED